MARQQQQGTVDKAAQFGGMLGGAYAMMKDLEKDTFKRGQDYLVGAEMYEAKRDREGYQDKMTEIWDTMLDAWGKKPDPSPEGGKSKTPVTEYAKMFGPNPKPEIGGGLELTTGQEARDSITQGIEDLNLSVQQQTDNPYMTASEIDTMNTISLIDSVFSVPQEEKATITIPSLDGTGDIIIDVDNFNWRNL